MLRLVIYALGGRHDFQKLIRDFHFLANNVKSSVEQVSKALSTRLVFEYFHLLDDYGVGPLRYIARAARAYHMSKMRSILSAHLSSVETSLKALTTQFVF